MSTLLEIVNKFSSRQGLPTVTQVATSTDTTVLQAMALLNEELEELTDRFAWSQLRREAQFTSVAAESQGEITTIAPDGFLWIIKDTIYNRTRRLPIFGPMTARNWQFLKALPTTGPFDKYIIRGGELLVNPTMTAGHDCYFEYASSYAVESATATLKAVFTADDDVLLLPEKVALAGLRWRWKREQGLDYAEEFNRWEAMAANAASRDATKPTLDMGGGMSGWQPGIFVPAGNWNVP